MIIKLTVESTFSLIMWELNKNMFILPCRFLYELVGFLMRGAKWYLALLKQEGPSLNLWRDVRHTACTRLYRCRKADSFSLFYLNWERILIGEVNEYILIPELLRFIMTKGKSYLFFQLNSINNYSARGCISLATLIDFSIAERQLPGITGWGERRWPLLAGY